MSVLCALDLSDLRGLAEEASANGVQRCVCAKREVTRHDTGPLGEA